MTGLTPKQELFCQKYIETGNASEAYRLSYNAAKMKPETVNRSAKELLDHPKITTRLEQLNKIHQDRHAVTVDSITKELEQARKLAFQIANPAAAISASMGKAKIHGLIVDKAEVKEEVDLSSAKSALLRGLIPAASDKGADQED